MLDSQLIFDGTLNPVAGAAITTTRDSTNVIDMLVSRDMGAGSLLGLHVQVMQNFATLTSLTVDFQASPTSPSSGFVSILKSNVYPVAQLVVGTPIFRYDWPLNQLLNATAGVLKAPGRYYKLVYTVAGSDATAGSVFAYLAPAQDRQEYWTYPENYATH